MKISELQGAALDWAVARAEEQPTRIVSGLVFIPGGDNWNPSSNWAQGGPIIEREEISISREFCSGGVEWACWTPAPFRDDAEAFGYGPTPLIAAMRCYVASKLGDEVEIPEEFLTTC